MKLEDIEKKHIFEVPDGYFDRLPMAIQERVAAQKQRAFALPSFVFSVKYAFPVLFVAITLVFLYKNFYANLTPDKVLSSVNTETLVAYLSESEITEEELIQSVNSELINFQTTPSHTLQTIDFGDR